MKSMTEGILNITQRIHNIISDVSKLGRAEEKELELLRIKTNINRINVLIILVFLIECLNLYIHFTSKRHTELKNVYFCLYLLMVLTCILQIAYFHILEWKYAESIRKHKWYVNLWLFHFIFITWCFHVLEMIENEHFENLFLLLVVLNIILILSNKEIIICSVFILVAEYIFLFMTKGKISNYQWTTIMLVCSGIIGRVFFVYYMNSNLLQWKLKKTNEELEEQIKRYQVLQALTEEDIFEYNHKEDKMILSFASERPVQIYYNYLEKVKQHYISFLDKENEVIILEAFRNQKLGKKKGTLCFNADTARGKRVYQTVFTTIYDESDNPLLTIGKLYQLGEGETSMNESGVDKISSFT